VYNGCHDNETVFDQVGLGVGLGLGFGGVGGWGLGIGVGVWVVDGRWGDGVEECSCARAAATRHPPIHTPNNNPR